MNMKDVRIFIVKMVRRFSAVLSFLFVAMVELRYEGLISRISRGRAATVIPYLALYSLSSLPVNMSKKEKCSFDLVAEREYCYCVHIGVFITQFLSYGELGRTV